MAKDGQVEQAARSESYDSDKQHLAAVYANSLLAAAKQAGNTDRVLVQLESYVADVLNRLPKLDQALVSQRLSAEARNSLIDKTTPGAEKEFKRFLKVVCQHGRADCLRAISAAAQRIHSEASGRVEAIAVTAAPVNDETRGQIQSGVAKLLGKEVDITFQVDPSILGGLIVRVGDTVYDGSLANQLNRARQRVTEKTSMEIRHSTTSFSQDS